MANGPPSGDHPIFGETGFDPAQPGDSVVFMGYHADLGDVLRIYLDLDMCIWVDVSKGDVLASYVDEERLAPSIMWVDRTATIKQGASETTDAQFLKGRISDRELGGTPSYGGRPWGPFCCSGTHTIVPMCSGTHI